MNTSEPRPVVVTADFPQPPRDVWRAWTEADQLRRWFGSHPDGVVLAARADVRVGGSFEVTFRDPTGDVHTCFGAYTLVEPPAKLGFTWRWVAAPDAVERVEVTLEDTGSGTRLTLVHADIDPATTHGYEAGWTSTFAKLRRALGQERQVAVRGPSALRVSNRDREAAVDRLQTAFLEGQITDGELAERIGRTLSARIGADLAEVLADLPAVLPVAPISPDAPRPLRLVQAYKGSAVQAGRWTVPARFRSESYKSHQLLDLTKAIVTAPQTEIRVSAYKSSVEIVVPPGLRVEVRKTGYASTLENHAGDGPNEGPLLVVIGRLYKSHVVIKRSGELGVEVSPST